MTSAVTQLAQVQAPQGIAPNTPDFADVRAVLDGVIRRWAQAKGREPDLDVHYGAFGWRTRDELVNADAFGMRFIEPHLLGNGRAEETRLIQVLRGTSREAPRMPLGGPYATDAEIDTIARWINAGAPDSRAKARASLETAPTGVRATPAFVQRHLSPVANAGLRLAEPAGYRARV